MGGENILNGKQNNEPINQNLIAKQLNFLFYTVKT